MSAKLLLGLTEDNPGLEKQIGCMTGIFQVLDRHHLVTGRRLTSNKRLPFPGQSRLSVTTHNEEHNPDPAQIILEYNRSNSSKDNRRSSVDSSASLSSLPRQLTRNDFRDVVKDNVLKQKDSPRPVMSVELNDALQVLFRLKDVPWSASEVPRFSCDGREFTRSKSSTKLRELPRLSLDSREVLVQSFDFDTETRVRGKSAPARRGGPSVVARLMGLDAMPGSRAREPVELVKSSVAGGERNGIAHSEPPRLQNTTVPKKTESVYSQIQRRASGLEFSQSNKDLRALKHILDNIQAKGILRSKESDDDQQRNNLIMPESPIVIMKPGKPVRTSGEPEAMPCLRNLRTDDSPRRKQKATGRAPMAKKKTGESSSQKNRTPPVPRSPRPPQTVRERNSSPAKKSSPIVQQRKIELEKKPRPLTVKQKANRKPLVPVVSTDGSFRVKQQARQADQMLMNTEMQSERSSSLEDSSSPISVLEAASYKISELPRFRLSADIECKNETNLSPTPLEQKLSCIKNLVEELRRLSSTDDDDNHVSRVLTSAGLASTEPESDTETLRQDLVFDAVTGILVQKLESLYCGRQRDLFCQFRKVRGQDLFAELCTEIEQAMFRRPKSASLDDEKQTFGEDFVRQSEGEWGGLGTAVPELVLEIERSIFKELINEVVNSKVASSGLQSRAARRRW